MFIIQRGVEDPLTSNAPRHGFLEMSMISLLSSLCGGWICVDMADFAADAMDPQRAASELIIGKAESVRVSEGQTRTETRTYVMSWKLSPEDFLNAVRMREDELRNRTHESA